MSGNKPVKNIEEVIDLMAAKTVLKRCALVLSDYTTTCGRNNDDVIQMINDVEVFLNEEI